MTKEITKRIKSLGIIPEDEHYDIAELIILECAAMAKNLSPHGVLTENAIKEHFGL